AVAIRVDGRKILVVQDLRCELIFRVFTAYEWLDLGLFYIGRAPSECTVLPCGRNIGRKGHYKAFRLDLRRIDRDLGGISGTLRLRIKRRNADGSRICPTE